VRSVLAPPRRAAITVAIVLASRRATTLTPLTAAAAPCSIPFSSNGARHPELFAEHLSNYGALIREESQAAIQVLARADGGVSRPSAVCWHWGLSSWP